MDRRNFIKKGSLAVIAISATGQVFAKSNGTFETDCETTNDILGPFYRPNAPKTQNLVFSGLAGNRIKIKGTVYTDDCKTPIEDALVEIWHCNTKGNYDNKSDKYLHRAKWDTDKDGAYTFNTILPGKYLNGKQYRPAHIHFRITAPDHKELISQIYFSGDPHIADDPWASLDKAKERILTLSPENTSGDLTVFFDIFLAKA